MNAIRVSGKIIYTTEAHKKMKKKKIYLALNKMEITHPQIKSKCGQQCLCILFLIELSLFTCLVACKPKLHEKQNKISILVQKCSKKH